MNEEIVYQNKWCKIVYRGTLIVLVSKQDKYNDQYFTTVEQAKKSIGINLTFRNHESKHVRPNL